MRQLLYLGWGMPASRRIERSVPSPLSRRGTIKLLEVIGLHHISCLAPSRTTRQPFRRRRASSSRSERLGMQGHSTASRSPSRLNTSSTASSSARMPFARSSSRSPDASFRNRLLECVALDIQPGNGGAGCGPHAFIGARDLDLESADFRRMILTLSRMRHAPSTSR